MRNFLAICSRPNVHEKEHSENPDRAQKERHQTESKRSLVELLGFVYEAVLEFGLGLERQTDGDQSGGKEEEHSECTRPTPVFDTTRHFRIVLLTSTNRVHGGAARDR